MANESSLRASEIKNALLAQIERYEEDLHMEEVGEVLEVKDGVARIFGLSSAVANEMLAIESSGTGEIVTALALNLEEDNIGAVCLGDYLQLKEGDAARRTGRVLSVPAGPEFLGRVVSSLGEPLDGKGPIQAATTMKVDRKAPGIVYRKPVDTPLQTGLKGDQIRDLERIASILDRAQKGQRLARGLSLDGKTEEQIRAEFEAEGRGLIDFFMDLVKGEIDDESVRDRMARAILEQLPTED